jgi:hypothetical protein
MAEDGDADITGMLVAAIAGDDAAAAKLVGLVYEDLRQRAEALMRRESPGTRSSRRCWSSTRT